MQCDLFLYDLATKEIRQLTDDLFNDAQPRFSPDGRSLVFSSERTFTAASERRGFFSNLGRDIFGLDLESGQITQYTFEAARCSAPMFDGEGGKLLYITEQEKISNFKVLDLATSEAAELTKVLSGVFSGDISPDNQYLLISNFFNGAWNLYFGNDPLSGLVYQPYPAPQPWQEGTDLLDGIELSRLDYFGKRPRVRTKRINPAPQYDMRRPLLGDYETMFEYTREDSLRLSQDFSYDDRPQTIATVPEIKPYRTRFSLDRLWGGLAYASGVGTIGYVELGLSDMMGNHGIGINAGISGKLEESNILLTYLYLKRRADYGVGVFNLFDEVYYRVYQPGLDDYYRKRVRQTGLYLLYRYPFSRFLRLDFDHQIYQRGQFWDKWQWHNDGTGEWIEDPVNDQDLVYTPGLTLVHDNALYGSTGPLLGWRALYTIRTTLADGKLDYLTNYLDWRSYTLFSRRYAIALRAIGGVSSGDNAQRFDLKGYYGVRAFLDDDSGHKKALVSAELRFPFMEYISIAFPLPITIGNIRGSVFSDLGTVFNDFKEFQGFHDNKLRDLKLSYGFGPRLNLGYVILRFDIAWLSDLSKISKPIYYLSLSEDF